MDPNNTFPSPMQSVPIQPSPNQPVSPQLPQEANTPVQPPQSLSTQPLQQTDLPVQPIQPISPQIPQQADLPVQPIQPLSGQVLHEQQVVTPLTQTNPASLTAAQNNSASIGNNPSFIPPTLPRSNTEEQTQNVIQTLTEMPVIEESINDEILPKETFIQQSQLHSVPPTVIEDPVQQSQLEAGNTSTGLHNPYGSFAQDLLSTDGGTADTSEPISQTPAQINTESQNLLSASMPVPLVHPDQNSNSTTEASISSITESGPSLTSYEPPKQEAKSNLTAIDTSHQTQPVQQATGPVNQLQPPVAFTNGMDASSEEKPADKKGIFSMIKGLFTKKSS